MTHTLTTPLKSPNHSPKKRGREITDDEESTPARAPTGKRRNTTQGPKPKKRSAPAADEAGAPSRRAKRSRKQAVAAQCPPPPPPPADDESYVFVCMSVPSVCQPPHGSKSDPSHEKLPPTTTTITIRTQYRPLLPLPVPANTFAPLLATALSQAIPASFVPYAADALPARIPAFLVPHQATTAPPPAATAPLLAAADMEVDELLASDDWSVLDAFFGDDL